MIRIGFFGTPFYSVKLLKAIFDDKHHIAYVVTNMDKLQGRKKILTPSPVKEFAMENSIPVFQFPNLKSDNAIEAINSIPTDLNIVFAFGSIIPKQIFEKPISKTMNLHTSLLPKFRGASPVESAIMAGDSITGISLQYITEELDAGNIISEKKIEILSEDTGGTLLDKLTNLGVGEIRGLLQRYEKKIFPSTPQNHGLASYCRKILPADRLVDFHRSTKEIFNKIRALNPYHAAYSMFRGKRINICESNIFNGEKNSDQKAPGALFLVDRKTLVVECGDGDWLELKTVQPENKNQISIVEFINGYRPMSGERLN